MANTANETGREGLVGEATSQVQDAASAAQEKAVELKEQGKGKLGETLDQRTNEAGEQARKMAQALRQSGEKLRGQGEAQQAAGVDGGRGGPDRAAGRATSSGRAATSCCAMSRTSHGGARG